MLQCHGHPEGHSKVSTTEGGPYTCSREHRCPSAGAGRLVLKLWLVSKLKVNMKCVPGNHPYKINHVRMRL